ncbi:tetratricopeptide repeat protein [bacterium]|nr:tetratricopeptide repeat protein [bacterium]
MTYVPEELIDQIEALKSEGKFEEALKVVNSILAKDPTNEE